MKKNVKVLVLDDDLVIKDTLVAYLEDEGFSTVDASNAEKALEILKKEKPDVGIIDIRLPGMDGDEFILKAHELHRNMKFIIYTGSVSSIYDNRLESVGMEPEDVILKPVWDLDCIVSALSRVIAKEHEIIKKTH